MLCLEGAPGQLSLSGMRLCWILSVLPWILVTSDHTCTDRGSGPSTGSDVHVYHWDNDSSNVGHFGLLQIGGCFFLVFYKFQLCGEIIPNFPINYSREKNSSRKEK